MMYKTIKIVVMIQHNLAWVMLRWIPIVARPKLTFYGANTRNGYEQIQEKPAER
jgi:hypothetical protein